MNASLVSGHILGSVVATVVWEVAIHLPTSTPGAALVTAGIVAPPVFAAVSLGLIALGERHGKPAAAPVPVPRRAVTGQPRRKELAR